MQRTDRGALLTYLFDLSVGAIAVEPKNFKMRSIEFHLSLFLHVHPRS